MKWFINVKTVEELRKRYKELLKVCHPDNGGSLADMQEINVEYDTLYSILSKEEHVDEQTSTYDTDEEDKAFREVLSKIIHIHADVEVVGKWLWVEKGAYQYKELLKEVGFHYAPRKKAWYWHAEPYCRRSKREISLDEIRQKYGTTTVNRKSKRQYVLD